MSQAIPSSTSLRSPRSLAAVLLAALALFFCWPVQAATAAVESPPTDTTVTWSVRPADTAQGSGRPNFAYEAPPGGTVDDAIVVTNRSSFPIDVDIYAADGYLTADGALGILARADPSTELGTWVAMEAPRISLASGESREIPFTVAVPAATTPGDYVAAIMTSMVVEGDGTVTERRLGSRIHLRVLGELVPALSVSKVSVDYSGTVNPLEGGTATVTYTLANTGNSRLDPDADVTLSGPFGWAGVAAGDDVPELLPGSSIERTVSVTGVPALGLLTADVSATAEVVTPSLDGAEPVPDPVSASATAATAAVPWTVLALVLIVAAFIVWRVVARRRAKAAQQRAIADAVAAARAEQAPPAELVDAAPASTAPRTDA